MEWYKSWFDTTYLSLYRHRDTKEANTFVEWIHSEFNREAQDGVLDLACGAGRHSISMADKYGWKVTGLDLSRSLLTVATKEMPKHLTISWIQGDMRHFPFAHGSFGLLLNAFTSFGYFSDESDHYRVLNECARVLRPDGLFLIDLVNRELLLDSLIPHDEEEKDGYTILQDRVYLKESNRVEKTIRIMQAGKQVRTVTESIRIFTDTELETMLKKAHLEPEGRVGTYNGKTYSQKSSPRMIYWARRSD